MFRSLLYSHLQSEPLKSVIYQSSFNCNYLIKSCVRLCNCIYSIFYWTQRGCLTWKWFQKRASSKYHKNRILTGNHTANYSNLPTFVFFFVGPYWRARVSSFSRFHDHTHTHHTRKFPLDKWWARRRDIYLTTHNTHNPSHRDSNSHSQQTSDSRVAPKTERPLASVRLILQILQMWFFFFYIRI